MEKAFYTFEEILLALREEYIKNQLLLKKLENYFVISGKKIDSFQINSKFQEISVDGTLYDKHLYLYVKEKNNKLKQAIVKLLNPSADIIRSVVYDITKGSDKCYSFKKSGINPSSKKLTISVTDLVGFNKLVEEILNSEFMSLTNEHHSSMFGGYNLDIDGGQIFCGRYGENVFYDATNDTVQFRGFDCQSDAQSFIRQPIHKFYIHDAVKKLIDSNAKLNQEVKIEEFKFKKVTELCVKNHDNGLVLMKKKI